jgi:hypothetical protein
MLSTQIVGAADNRDYTMRAPADEAVEWIKAIRSALQLLRLSDG